MSGGRLIIYPLAVTSIIGLLVFVSPALVMAVLDYRSCNPRTLRQVIGRNWTANATERTCLGTPAKTELTLATIRNGVVFNNSPILTIEGSHRIKAVWLGDKRLEVSIPRNGRIYTQQQKFEDVSIIYKRTLR